MPALTKLTWVELKLFAREPITAVFTFALPLITLFVMGGVFGNTPDPEGKVYRGIGAMTFYVPAYIGLVLTAIGLIALPVHLAGYRERGVLRRLRASSVSVWGVIGSQLLVMLVIGTLCAVILFVAASLSYGSEGPHSLGLVILAFLVSSLSYTALGILLGAVMPTARAAQGIGLLLYFAMLMLSGGGPPPEVLNSTLRGVAQALPGKHVTVLLQDPWLGFGWNMTEFVIVFAIFVGAALLAYRFFKWE